MSSLFEFEGQELVIATHNAGKVREIEAFLRGLPENSALSQIEHFYSALDLGLPEPEETGASFKENAVLKAEAAARGSGKLSLADDSGLSVEALGGDPGIYSARWAEQENGVRDFDYGMEKVRLALVEACGTDEGHRAAFVCVLALARPDGEVVCFEGRVSGVLSFSPRGAQGFGYDPIFVPDGYDLTFAEMSPEEKHALSHRAVAFKKFVEAYA